MKRFNVFMILFFISSFVISSVYASSYRESYAKYENKQIKLIVISKHITGFNRRTARPIISRYVEFHIKSKPGFKILNISNVELNGKKKKFNGQTVYKKYIKKGKTWIRGVVGPKKIFTLTYFVCKIGSEECQRIVKKFKFVVKSIPRPRGRTMAKLVEVR